MSINNSLLSAIRLKDYDNVKHCLKSGAEISYKDQFGCDAFYYSVVYPDNRIFELILEEDINFKESYSEGGNILHVAIKAHLEERGHLRIIEKLLEKGVNPNFQDKFGNTPLWYACMFFGISEQTIKLLIRFKAASDIPNIYGSSVRSWAAENNVKEVIEIINGGGNVSGSVSD
ncbi:MAG: ankyrin repeat domain-containing protein [Chitinophagales bacterium]|nr:ankyrin repeat domain-containing protein [Chitinophagales bacterium]